MDIKDFDRSQSLVSVTSMKNGCQSYGKVWFGCTQKGGETRETVEAGGKTRVGCCGWPANFLGAKKPSFSGDLTHILALEISSSGGVSHI